jgi:acetyltransferase-like isoleucine patch superfamily enzyme
MPGALGFLLRKMLYPRMFMRTGRDVLWGRHIALRHPGRIRIGNGTAIDDYCMLDARGAGPRGVTLEDQVLVSRNCVIQGKQGPVYIGARTNFGCNCVVTSVGGVRIGAEVLLAANCYIGGGRYHSDQTQVSIMNQGIYSLGEVVIGDGVWLGSGATVLDGVRIGSRTVVGAGAVVVHDLPENVIAGGTPARILRTRDSS